MMFLSIKVPAQLNYSHGYFVRFPHTGADIIAHLLEFSIIKLVCLCHSYKTASWAWNELVPARVMRAIVYFFKCSCLIGLIHLIFTERSP